MTTPEEDTVTQSNENNPDEGLSFARSYENVIYKNYKLVTEFDRDRRNVYSDLKQEIAEGDVKINFYSLAVGYFLARGLKTAECDLLAQAVQERDDFYINELLAACTPD